MSISNYAPHVVTMSCSVCKKIKKVQGGKITTKPKRKLVCADCLKAS